MVKMKQTDAAPTLIEAFVHGAWVPVATLQVFGPELCRIDYVPENLFSDKPTALSHAYPVGVDPDRLSNPDDPDSPPDRRPPSFIYDLVPQGRGRKHLLSVLGLGDSDQVVLPLVMAGTFNPIGHLRVRSAVEFFQRQLELNPVGQPSPGLTLKDITGRSHDFIEHISLHSMLAAGTTGVQGVAPKFLLAVDHDGLFHADLALEDDKAARHFLVKLPRGSTRSDIDVLRNEAAYLRLAAMCGVRSAKATFENGNMLFSERFDRQRTVESGRSCLVRLPQESLASVAGLRSFAPATSQNDLLRALRVVASDPTEATIDFLKRDVLNMAMRNTDNHARNSAVQTLHDGTVQLSPVFDFAPMFMDPEVVVRSVHWRNAEGVRLNDWNQIFCQIDVPHSERLVIANEMMEFGEVVERLPQMALEAGVDPDVVKACSQTIRQQVDQLADIDVLSSTPCPGHG